MTSAGRVSDINPHRDEADHRLPQAPKFQGENFYNNKKIVDAIRKLADKKGCSLSQVAIAWVAQQGMIPIPGTSKPQRLESNFASRNIGFSDEEQRQMRAILDSNKAHGNRYGEKNQALVGH